MSPAATAIATPAATSAAADVRDAMLRADDARVQGAAHRAAVDAALRSTSADVQVLAVRALGRTRRAEFLPSVVPLLDHVSIDVRREAAFAVAHIGSGEPSTHETALAALVARLGRERDPFVTATLAESIGRLPFPSATAIEDAAGRVAAAWSASAAGPSRAVVSLGVARGAEAMARRARQSSIAGSNAPRLVALHESLIDAHAPPASGGAAPQDLLDRRVRRLASSGLITLRALSPSRRSAAAVDPDAQVRRLAVLDLAARPEVSESDAVQLFSDESVLVRHAAVARLGTRLRPLAEKAATDAHIAVRLAAIDALGEAKVCRTVCLVKLREPHTSDTWHQAAHALVALARTDVDAARPYVARAAASDVWQVRMYAARAAGATAQADILDRLAADANPNVRHAALVAWREAKLPNLTTAAVAALGSDDGQLVLEAATALRGVAAAEPGVPAVGAVQPGVAAGLVPRTDIVSALRSALQRLTALKRDTLRDPRVAVIERIDELDSERETTLRPYLADFDPFVRERVATLLKARQAAGGTTGATGGPTGGAKDSPESSAAPTPMAGPARVDVPTWQEVTRLQASAITFRLRSGRVMSMRLYAEQAPTAVARLVAQVKAGEWDGRTFHRVEPGFVVQGGSAAANEYAGAAAFARDEFSALSHVRGAVGISTRGADTGDGQIFINLVDNARLDFSYTIVGALTGDLAGLDDMVEGEVIASAVVVGEAAAKP